MKQSELIEKAKEALKLPSDYALALRMGVKRQRVSALKSEEHPRPASNQELVWLANAIKQDPLTVIAAIEIERDAANADFWKPLAKPFLDKARIRTAITAVLRWLSEPGQDGHIAQLPLSSCA